MKNTRILVLVVLADVLVMPVAARSRQSAAVCSLCNMRISESEKRFSVIMPKVPLMSSSAYDDIGCAVLARNIECATRQMTFDSNAVAYDYLSGGKVPVERAFFVFRSDVKSPMRYGIVAFKDRGQAEQLAAKRGKGKVIRWFELVDEKVK